MPRRPQLIVSTHFDDAALSLGQLLQQARDLATVVTVCGGRPPRGRLEQWDRDSRFPDGREAARVRAREDECACAITGARPHPLGHWDSPYRTRPLPKSALRREIEALLPRDGVLWMPAGIDNADHVNVRDALLPLAADLPPARVRVYADLPYAGPPGKDALPEPVRRALPALTQRDVHLSDAEFARKLTAVRCHASQLDLLSRESAWPDLLARTGPLARERIWTAYKGV